MKIETTKFAHHFLNSALLHLVQLTNTTPDPSKLWQEIHPKVFYARVQVHTWYNVI